VRAIPCLAATALALAAAPARAEEPRAPATTPAAVPVQPVTKDASPEAQELLRYLYEISGQHTLSGQHCVPLVASTRLVGVHRQTKRYPALFGQDFGFGAAGSWDGINYRQQLVDEAIRRHAEGFVITLMWHAVRPNDEEPVEFRDSVQGRLSDEQWRELTTPGTALNERWKSQVDVIAWHLKQLREARVPVLWRPYHEMNGEWFWWGKRPGDGGYRKLYRMLFERLTVFHRLNNLVWVWNANEIREDVGPYAAYFPGADVVDVLATDVYRNAYAQSDYDQLLAVAGAKPIALGEVGRLPSPEVLRAQPRWTWFMAWGDPEGAWLDRQSYLATYESPEVLTRDELPWVEIKQPRIHYPVLR
jgi:mannan endo-1,4-beta-mannosidase